MKSEMPRCITLGITGGVGCGKSEVGRILERWGWAVCDTDDLAHAALAPEGAAYEAVVTRFGQEILDRDGRVVRDRLARIVFSDERARAELNTIVHPVVRKALQDWLAGNAHGRDRAVLVPLLFEAGWTEGWTAIVCVAAGEQTVMERLARRGWGEEDMRQRMAAQWPLEEKKRRADYVIDNNGSLYELECAVRRMLNRIREQEENRT